MSKTNVENLVKYYLQPPDVISQSYVAWAEEIATTPGVTFGCKALDSTIPPLRPGNKVAFVARPGNGKSTVMAALLKREAQAIIDRGEFGRQCVMYIGWDQPAEETDAFFQANGDYTPTQLIWGKADLDKVRANAIKRAMLPIYHISYSQRHRGERRPPPPTMDDVYQIIEHVVYSLNVQPTLVALDYIQKVPVKRGMSRTDAVTEATYQATELCSRIGTPMVVGVQANREVSNLKYPIPGLEHAQHSSAIEQEMDRLFGLWIPRTTHNNIEFPTIPIEGVEYANDPRLMVMKRAKHRMEEGFGVVAFYVDHATVTLHDIMLPPKDEIVLPKIGPDDYAPKPKRKSSEMVYGELDF